MPPETVKKAGPAGEIEIPGTPGREFSILLPGSGWIYLADRDSGSRVELLRKLAGEDSTSFVFLTWEPGEYLLKFQQQNLAANIVRSTSRNVRVREDVETPSIIPGRIDSSRPVAPALDQRGDEIARIEKALLSGSDQDPGRDRLLFVLASFYEEESLHKNVKKALALYQSIVDKHPLSPHYRDAWARAQYLKRQYFDVR